jgi:hypothetical protein
MPHVVYLERYGSVPREMGTFSMDSQEIAEHLIEELGMEDMEHQTDSASSLNDPDGAPLLAPILERVLADGCREHLVNQEVVQTLVRSKLP